MKEYYLDGPSDELLLELEKRNWSIEIWVRWWDSWFKKELRKQGVLSWEDFLKLSPKVQSEFCKNPNNRIFCF